MITSFYDHDELCAVGFRRVGQNVLISRKASIYSPEQIEVGDNVRIDDFCILSGRIVLGNNIHIAAYSALYGSDKGIFIDDFSNISSRVSIYSVNDDYSGHTLTNPTLPDEFKNVDNREVIIEKEVVIGSTSVVLPGAILREGSAFGAFSFIKDDSEPWSINVGIPARKIKDRSKDLIHLEEQYRQLF